MTPAISSLDRARFTKKRGLLNELSVFYVQIVLQSKPHTYIGVGDGRCAA